MRNHGRTTPTATSGTTASHENARIGVKLTPDVATKLKEKLAQEPVELAGRKIDKINRIDGVKFLFADGSSWMLMSWF